MGSLSRSVGLALSLAILIASVFARHHHEAGTLCEICLYAPSGRRNADLPTVDTSDLLCTQRADSRTTEVRVKRVIAAVATRIFPLPASHLIAGFEEKANRIHAPPEARFLRDIAAGLNGRAPPLG